MRITLGALKPLLALAGLAAATQAPAAQAQSAALPPSVLDSFPLGNGGNDLCQVRSRAADAAIQGPFDRAWAVVCSDSALPVGCVFARRRDGGDRSARLAERRSKDVDCAGAAAAASTTVGDTSKQRCHWRNPVRPVLLTSFGPAGQSDGLLTFGEIFELKFDADMVILSACDTAGEADVQSIRAAGVATGGGISRDGPVRAFIGAGARAVLASEWQSPRGRARGAGVRMAITGLFSAGAAVSTGEALLLAGQKLMADPLTSRPYYWAGFAVVGDATRPLVRSNAAQASAAISPSTTMSGAAALAAGSR